MVDYGTSPGPEDDRTGTTSWRLVNRTGNCCENYLTTTANGRLLDFGGSYIYFSDDRGLTWTSVRPAAPLVNGEGAIVVAPDGDVLGVEWDPYSGDHLQSYKYDAQSKSWAYLEIPYHEAFYDREWIGVVPGPFGFDDTVPYVSYFKGGVASGKELWYRSTDGLTYTEVSSKYADEMVNDAVEGPLPTVPDPALDWVQANTQTGLTPLGGGRALAAPDLGGWAILDRDSLEWAGFAFPDGAPRGRYQVDSAGRVHNLRIDGPSVEYRMSSDGGVSWETARFALPADHTAELVDFRANKAAGIAAVAIRASASKDADLLYTLDITGSKPVLRRRYAVGLGDFDSTAGVLNNVRMDFQTVAIFPDGRVAMSVLDSTTTATALRDPDTTGPELAIEGDTTLPAGAPPPPPQYGPPTPPTPAAVTGRHVVRLKVTRRGSRLTFRGSVEPPHPGHFVTIERRRGRRWVAIAEIRASELSTFRYVRRIRGLRRTGERFRAVVRADAVGRGRGVSRAVAPRRGR